MAALRAAETPEEEARLLDDRRALRGRLTALRAAVEATPARLVDTGRTLADDWHAAEAVAARRALLVRAALDAVTAYPAASHRAADRAARPVVLAWRDDYGR